MEKGVYGIGLGVLSNCIKLICFLSFFDLYKQVSEPNYEPIYIVVEFTRVCFVYV